MKPDRTRQPALVIPDRVGMPGATVHTLANGMELYAVQSTAQHLLRVSFVFRAGSACQSHPFVASATANLLGEGTARYTAAGIADRLDFYGSYYDVSLDRDYAVVTVCSLSKFLPQTLEVLGQMLLHPTFPEAELRTYADKRKQQLAVERGKVSFRARELFAASLFGPEHPYGVSYDAARYDELTPELLRDFYARHYTAANGFVVASGRITPAALKAIGALAAGLPAGSAVPVPVFPAVAQVPEAFAAQPGAVQSAIRIGRRLFTRDHPDFIPMQVLVTVLGGYFGSRLVANLREERGYTYGVFAALVNLDREGYMAIATEVTADATDDAVAQVFAEMERLRTEPVGDEELEAVRNIMTGEVMRLVDGPFGVADVTIENIQSGSGPDYVDRFVAAVRGVTPAQLPELARRWFDPAAFTTVVVGPGK